MQERFDSLVVSLRSKRFRAISEQRTRSVSFLARPKPKISLCSRNHTETLATQAIGGKTCNKAFQLFLLQCWKTSCAIISPGLPYLCVHRLSYEPAWRVRAPSVYCSWYSEDHLKKNDLSLLNQADVMQCIKILRTRTEAFCTFYIV